MAISAVGGASAQSIQTLVQMRAQLDDLQRQLSTGQKSATYAGLGSDRGLTVSLRAQLANMAGFDNTIDNVMTRINLAQAALGRISDIGHSTKASLNQANYSSGATGQTTAQANAAGSLDELIGLLNTRAGDRYLFSGNMTDQPTADSLDHILNGNGAQAGLKQLISERNQADLGAGGLGRLTLSAPSATSVAIAEDAGVFGLKLASASSTLTGATVTGPGGGPPASLSVDLGATNPNAGEGLTVRFTLPDGSSENITLTATTASPPGANQFTIGATSADTAANLKTALTDSIGALAATSLAAASAVQASNEFFDADNANPPMRVDGPPFDAATSLTAGSAANSVIWYTGDAGSSPARATATARIDPSLAVAYGVRASEDGIRSIVRNVALVAAMTYSTSDPNAVKKSAALNQRVATNLDAPSGQTVVDIEGGLAAVQNSLQAAKQRHSQVSGMLGDFLQQVSGVSNEDVGAQILTLQTRLQAALQTTAMLYQVSLVNYLK